MAFEDSEPKRRSFFDLVTEQNENESDGTGHEGELAADEAISQLDEESTVEVIGTDNPSSESSSMPHEARRVLVYLMRQGVILDDKKPQLFQTLCRYESHVRRHLSEVYLQLVLDTKSGVAFVASKDSEYQSFESDQEIDGDEESTSLISKRTLSLHDTLLLLVLRKHYQDRESSGEHKVTIDVETIESYMTPFQPLTEHASLDRKKLVARVKEMVKRKILSTIRGSDDRYEITPVIRFVVNADFLQAMLDEYKRMATDLGITKDDNADASGPSHGEYE